MVFCRYFCRCCCRLLCGRHISREPQSGKASTYLLVEPGGLIHLCCIALDKVQKQRPLSDEEFKRLKGQHLIEGRRPNLLVSAKVAVETGDKAAYIKNRGLDKAHYKAPVISFLKKFMESKREDLDGFLREKISDALSPDQKTNRIRNLLQEMRREGMLSCEGHCSGAIWKLAKLDSDQNS